MTALIVVGVDGSESSIAAVEWAATDAVRQDASLRLVHVHEPWASNPLLVSSGEEFTRHCQALLASAADLARQRAPHLAVVTDLVTGAIAAALMRESELADTVVLGSRGAGGFSGLVLGSVGLAVAGHAAGPVVIVRGTDRPVQGEVVVGYDGSPHAEAAMAYAIAQARLRGARLRVLYAWTMPMASPYAVAYGSLLDSVFANAAKASAERVAPWRDKYPDLEIIDSALCLHPIAALAEASRTADLVVVGSRGLGGFASAMLGSVSHGLLHHAHCPVAVVTPR